MGFALDVARPHVSFLNLKSPGEAGVFHPNFTGARCFRRPRRFTRLSQVLGLDAPFDLDVAQFAVLETQLQGSEESLRHEHFDVYEQPFHESRIWVRF